MSYQQIPNSELDSKYATICIYNIYADSEKDVILYSNQNIYKNDLVGITFADCYEQLKIIFPYMMDC